MADREHSVENSSELPMKRGRGLKALSWTCAFAAITMFAPALCQAQPAVASGGVISAGAFGAFTAVAPGSWIEIYGSNLAAHSRSWSRPDALYPGAERNSGSPGAEPYAFGEHGCGWRVRTGHGAAERGCTGRRGRTWTLNWYKPDAIMPAHLTVATVPPMRKVTAAASGAAAPTRVSEGSAGLVGPKPVP